MFEKYGKRRSDPDFFMTYERTEEEELRILVVGFAFVSPLAITTKAVIIFLHQHKRASVFVFLSELSFIFAFVV